VTRVAVVQSRTSLWRDDFSVVQEAARKYAVMPVALVVPDDAREIENELAGFAREGTGGLIVPPDVITLKHRQMIADLAAKHRLPASYFERRFVQAGGLISFGAPLFDYRRVGGYIDRVLRGMKVSDLPVQAESTFELIINLKTAKALGLEVSPSLLITANEVIE
jgi:putative ABC transport system substrate-binding protein